MTIASLFPPYPTLVQPTAEELREWDEADIIRISQSWHEAIANAQNDPLRNGDHPSHWWRAKELLEEDGVDSGVCFGGNRCLAPEQEIFDPVKLKWEKIKDINGYHHVYAWDKRRNLKVVAVCGKPFRKPRQVLVHVTLDNGESFRCSVAHRVLTPAGWRSVASCTEGTLLATSGTCLSKSFSSGVHSSGTVPDFQSGYRPSRRSYGELLLHDSNGVLDAAPLRAYALKCIGHVFSGLDVLENTLRCNRLYSLASLPSTPGVLQQILDRFSGILSRVFYRPCKSALRLFGSPRLREGHPQSLAGSILLESTPGSTEPGNQSHRTLALGDNSPVRRIVKVDYLRVDDVWDFHVPNYNNYFIGSTIHHNSGKTSFASWLIINAMMKNPGTAITCWSQTKDTSVIVQQARMFHTLPPEYRTTCLTGGTDIHFKFASGFVNNQFTLPNGSTCYFRYYSQFMLNPNLMEGIELGWKGAWGEKSPYVNIGNWFDEYLIHGALMRTMEERLTTRNAKSLMTFTPINQYTPVVRDILKGMVTEETEMTLPDDPEQIRNVEVPYIQRKDHRAVIYFATHKNLHNPYDRSKRNQIGRSKPWALMKLYGVPTDLQSRKFPRFSEEVHVIEELPDKDSKKFGKHVPGYTRYEICDPAGDKPWFRIWVAVDKRGTHYIYREWPDFGRFGAWADRPEEMATVSDGEKWAAGPAAIDPRACGLSFEGQKELLEELEGDEEIFERYLTAGDENQATAAFSEMADLDVFYSPATVLPEQEALQAAQALFDHSEKRKPKIQILSCCGNVIRSLTGYDTKPNETDKNHPWKDPFDCLLKMAASDLDYVKEMEPEEAWGGY